MGYERYPRNYGGQSAGSRDRDPQDYGRDYGSGRDQGYFTERDDSGAARGRGDYGRSRDDRDDGRSYGQGRYARDIRGDDDHYRGGDADGRYPQGGGQNRFGSRGQGDYGRQPEGYDYEERGFVARAGDEVRSWFGDEEAERRREFDSRGDDRYYQQREGADRDDHYHSWRASQIAALDRDYDEYRNENRTKFHNEFSSWRSSRQGQRDSLSKVEEHMDVVGSDGEHVGTVDKVRGDRIILTKNDADAGGRHHSIPSRWIKTVDSKVTLDKSAEEAKSHWRDEERNQAFFNEDRDQRGDRAQSRPDETPRAAQQKGLNRSFSGTY